MNDAFRSNSFSQHKAGSKSKIHANDSSLSVLGKVAYFGALVIVLIFAIPHGTVEPWAKGALVVAISVLGILRVADGLFAGSFRMAEWRLLLPMIGIAVLAGLQLIPGSSGSPLSADSYETQSFILVF